jgi:hypothetical protein
MWRAGTSLPPAAATTLLDITMYIEALHVEILPEKRVMGSISNGKGGRMNSSAPVFVGLFDKVLSTIDAHQTAAFILLLMLLACCYLKGASRKK